MSQLSSSACSALGDIFRSGPLPLLDGGEQVVSDDSGSNNEQVLNVSQEELTKKTLVNVLCKKFKSGKEVKVGTVGLPNYVYYYG